MRDEFNLEAGHVLELSITMKVIQIVGLCLMLSFVVKKKKVFLVKLAQEKKHKIQCTCMVLLVNTFTNFRLLNIDVL